MNNLIQTIVVAPITDLVATKIDGNGASLILSWGAAISDGSSIAYSLWSSLDSSNDYFGIRREIPTCYYDSSDKYYDPENEIIKYVTCNVTLNGLIFPSQYKFCVTSMNDVGTSAECGEPSITLGIKTNGRKLLSMFFCYLLSH